nr:MAG TPA: hypothetical protein [Caudoviricetes sp.]DAS88971.1 MAG TPA: hypothetical protein [Caudoviricetes sp.]DAY46926.1 MAG TPA: hypothetical protein [Caudoviricetes sp.]
MSQKIILVGLAMPAENLVEDSRVGSEVEERLAPEL